jgi:hypothetical protein
MNKQRLIELLSMPLTELKADTNLQKELTEYYKFIYGLKACSSCKNKFDSYYQKLMVDGVERMTETPSNFKLRNDIGVLRISFENGLYISQTEAPDEVCLEFLRANPNRISLFEKYPENLMDLIKNNENEIENE